MADADLEPGLHEALVTDELRARIEQARADGWLVEWRDIDDAKLAEILARHVHDRALEAIERVPSSMADRRRARVELVNRAARSSRDVWLNRSGAVLSTPKAHY